MISAPAFAPVSARSPTETAPGAPSEEAAERIASLDGIRGLAAGMVLFFHFFGISFSKVPLERFIADVAEFGSAGVDLFFLLSGFLITGILLDTSHTKHFFRNFYVRRVLRIFPLYFGVLLLVSLAIRLRPAGDAAVALRLAEPWAWLYGMNFFLGLHSVHTYIDHFWSLAVEEHFYLVWPIVVWLLRRQRNGLLLVALVVAVSSRVGRLVAALLGVNALATEWWTPFRLDALCVGACIAVVVRKPGGLAGLRRWLPWAVASGALLVALQLALRLLPAAPPTFVDAPQSVGVVLLFAALLVHALSAPSSALVLRVLTSRSLLFLGTYSYGIYVFHAFLSRYTWIHQPDLWLGHLLGSHVLGLVVQALIGTALSIGIAVLSYELYEKRFLALKSRFAPRAASTAQVEGAL